MKDLKLGSHRMSRRNRFTRLYAMFGMNGHAARHVSKQLGQSCGVFFV